jgi:hypothetical protein
MTSRAFTKSVMREVAIRRTIREILNAAGELEEKFGTPLVSRGNDVFETHIIKTVFSTGREVLAIEVHSPKAIVTGIYDEEDRDLHSYSKPTVPFATVRQVKEWLERKREQTCGHAAR